MPIKEFIPNDKIIYSFNMYKEFRDKASFRKDYLNKHHYFKDGLFIRGNWGVGTNSLCHYLSVAMEFVLMTEEFFLISLVFPFMLTSHLSISFFAVEGKMLTRE